MTVVEFFKRHRNKVFVTIGVTASAWALTRYVKGKFIELQERILTERFAKENLERRFEQNQRDATFTILALLPTLGVHVLARFDVEAIKKELQSLRDAHDTSATAAPKAIEAAGLQADGTQPALKDSSNLTGAAHGPDGSATDSAISDSLIESGNLANSALGNSLASSSLLPPEGESEAGPLSKSINLEESYVKTPSKSELWDEIKVQSISRAFTLVYGTALLVLLTRIQLNVLGRRTYVASVEEVTGSTLPFDQSEELDHVHRQYLTFSWWLLNKGWETLARRVQTAVEAATVQIDARTELGFGQLNEIIGRIQYLIDHPEPSADNTKENADSLGASLLPILLPPKELETYVLQQAPGSVVAPDTVDGALQDMLNETADLIESPNASDVVVRLVHSGLSVLISRTERLFGAECRGSTKLAAILATMTREAHQLAVGHPMTNDYVDAMIEQPQLDAFCAVIYTNF